jgi:hypothetical protein
MELIKSIIFMSSTKKNKSIIFNIISLLFIALTINAQEINLPADNSASIVSSNSLKRKPLGSYYGYERSAFIFTKEELNQTSSISIQSISFFCDTINSFIAANTPIKIYLKTTNDSLFTIPTIYSNEIINSSLVFSGNIASSQFIVNNWITINFSNYFVLPANTNLKLFIESNAGGSGNESSLSKGFRFKTTADKKFQYWQQDQTAPFGVGTLDTLRPNVKINYNFVANCNGVPLPGTIQLSDTAVCKGSLTSCFISGETIASGISYKWQQSIDQQSWTTLNQIGNSVQLNIDTTIYIRSIIYCNNIDSAITPVVSINNLLPVYCYCNNNLGGNCNGYSIDSLSIQNTTFAVSLNGCENNAGPHYSYYFPTGSATASLSAGQTYSVSIRQTGNNYSSIWIDYNHNGLFEASEWTRLSINSVTNGLQNYELNVPSTSYNGLTGMRVRSRNSSFPITNSQACSNFSSGETEDFMITITNGLNIGIEESTINKKLGLIFPNPTNDQIFYQNNFINGEIEIEIIDALGKLVFTQVNNHAGTTTIKPQLEKGFYFVSIKQKSITLQIVKLIVE